MAERTAPQNDRNASSQLVDVAPEGLTASANPGNLTAKDKEAGSTRSLQLGDSSSGTIVADTSDGSQDDDQSNFDLFSLTSDINRHEFENGRRYHGYRPEKYPHPNDEKEAAREALKHEMMRIMLDGKLFLAPIDTSLPHKVLDVGTGTGIWAIDLADEYPHFNITGVDLSPMQPQMVPPNCHFEIDDVEQEWTYGSNVFTFVHSRHNFVTFSSWPTFLKECLNVLKPGGYVQLVEMDIVCISDDNTIPAKYAVNEWLDVIHRASATRGMDLHIAPKMAGLLREAGFDSVRETKHKLPIGNWPRDRRYKEIGTYHREQLLEGLQGLVLRYLTSVELWSVLEVEVWLVEVRKHLRDRRIHCYWMMYLVHGRKPLK